MDKKKGPPMPRCPSSRHPWSVLVAAVLAASISTSGCGADALTSAAAVATLQAQQAQAARVQQASIAAGFKAAQDAERARGAQPEASP